MRPKVCIDAGHGGGDPGALGPNGLKESETALHVALILGNLLQADCDVILTRSTDVFLSLSRRAEIANQKGSDVFLSIHCNSGPPGQGKGFEVWTSPGRTESDRFAVYLYQAYANKFPAMPRRQDTSDGDPDKESPFTVLVKAKMPAALFELEFIHTEGGERWLGDPSNRRACAEALADGVRDYLGIELQQPEPVRPPEPSRPPLEVEMLAIFDRMSLRVDQARGQARTELEALFRK